MESESKVNQIGGTETAPAQSASESGPDASRKSLGKYELKKKLGAGGMGWVYLAHDTEKHFDVALKVLPRSKAANPQLVKRFKAEADAAAQLNHPGIVRIYEAGEVDGYLYIALEYFKGTDAYQLVSRLKTLPVQRSIDMVKQVVRALDHAFEKAIVHRDIKPSNLLVSRDGTVKLTDMGLARSVDETADAGITRAGTTVGTVDYMAPEQAKDSRAADVRSDIYSLACTWYHLLTGEPPFPGGALTNKLFAHFTAPRPDPRLKNPAVPKEVVEILHKMMARRPKDRYQTPVELLDDLEALDAAEVEIEAVGEKTFVSTLKDAVSYETGADFEVPKTPTSLRLPVRPRRRQQAPVWNFVDARFVTIAVVGVLAFAILYWVILRRSNRTFEEQFQQPTRNAEQSDSNDATNKEQVEVQDQGDEESWIKGKSSAPKKQEAVAPAPVKPAPKTEENPKPRTETSEIPEKSAVPRPAPPKREPAEAKGTPKKAGEEPMDEKSPVRKKTRLKDRHDKYN